MMKRKAKSKSKLLKELSSLQKELNSLRKELAQCKKIEKSLREAEKQYRQLFENAQNIICIISEEGKIIATNSAVEAITGWSRKELLGKNFQKFLHPDDLKIVEDRLKEILQGKKLPALELRIRTKSGEYVYAEFLGQVWKIKDKVKWIFGIAREVTARKQIEQELNYQLKLERIISNLSSYFINLPLENLDAGINYALQEIAGFFGVEYCCLFLFSEDGAKISLNYVWCAEGIGAHIKKLKNLPVKFLSWLVQPLRRQEVFHLSDVQEFSLRSKVEKRFFLDKKLKSLLCIPIFYREKLAGFLALGSFQSPRDWEENTILMLRLVGEILANVLERKELEESLRNSEQQYRLTLNAMNDMIHMVDQDLKILLFNTAFKRMNQALELKTEVNGKSLKEVFPFLSKKVLKEYQWVFSRGKPLRTEEVTKIGKEEFYTETLKIPVWEKGKVSRVVTVIRDITAQKKAEQALREAMERYQALVRLLPESIVVMDLKGNIVDLTQRALELHSYKNREELIGKSGYVLVAPEERERVNKIALKVFKQGIIKDVEYMMFKKDGSRAPALMSFSLLKDSEGKSKGIIGIAQEIKNRGSVIHLNHF